MHKIFKFHDVFSVGSIFRAQVPIKKKKKATDPFYLLLIIRHRSSDIFFNLEFKKAKTLFLVAKQKPVFDSYHVVLYKMGPEMQKHGILYLEEHFSKFPNRGAF